MLANPPVRSCTLAVGRDARVPGHHWKRDGWPDVARILGVVATSCRMLATTPGDETGDHGRQKGCDGGADESPR